MNSTTKQPTILAIDTATEACSAALLYQNRITAEFTEAPRAHTEKILPMVDNLLSTAQIALNQVDAIAFGRGPGSFTGVRVGVSVAQGLGFGANLPLIPVSNLLMLAERARKLTGENTIATAIDARMGEIYCAVYQFNEDSWHAVLPESVLKPEVWNQQINEYFADQSIRLVTAGTGFQTYQSILTAEKFSYLPDRADYLLPHAGDMLPLAKMMFAKQELINAMDAEPTYLRNEVTWQKLPGRE